MGPRPVTTEREETAMAWKDMTPDGDTRFGRVGNPGAPATTREAENLARDRVAAVLSTSPHVPADRVGAIAGHLTRHHSAAIEADVDAAGKAVQRYVLRGEWEPVELTADAVALALDEAVRTITEGAASQHLAVIPATLALDAIARAAGRLGVTL